jgi:flagellar biosynthesis protein FlhA
MTESSTGTAAAQPLQALLGKRIAFALRQTDVMLAVGVVAVLVILILPLPSWLLDICLAFSITLSVLILLTSLFIQRPLDFNAFPTILLLATMVRLALNLASTRLILSRGHEGPTAAGDVIDAFGGFVMGGNFVTGIIVFAILVIVNFVVITKGSGRIAEVSARFTLDAMPGKQMAIDADLSAGLITEEDARVRRRELEEESSFFGAMDGAAKFVRGDAVAGLLITFINVVGGIVIGVAQKGITLTAAAETYTRLTVGDGLVTQVPALLVSTAAGIVVTKAGLSGATEKAVFSQLGGDPKVLAISATLLAALAVLPGIPAVPFLLLAGGVGALAWAGHRKARTRREAEAAAILPPAEAAEEPISSTLRLDDIRLELGYSLLPLVTGLGEGPKLSDQIKALRRQLAAEFGFVMPSVRIQDNMQLQAEAYVIRIREIPAGRGELRPSALLVMDPRGDKIALPGEKTHEPAFGLAATWIDRQHREEALFKGYTVIEPATVITTHLTEVIKDNMADLLSYSETRKLLDELGKDHQKLVSDLVPGQISYTGIQRILQNLLAERISIRDLATILEGIAEACGQTRSPTQITEHVRLRLARQISEMYTDERGYLPLVALGPGWEQTFAESLSGNGDDRQLAIEPSRLHEFISTIRKEFEKHSSHGETPVLLTSASLRPYVRSIVERFRPITAVVSQNEIHARARIRTIGQI